MFVHIYALLSGSVLELGDYMEEREKKTFAYQAYLLIYLCMKVYVSVGNQNTI